MEFRSVSLRDCLYHCSVKNFQQNCTCDFAPEKSRSHTFSVGVSTTRLNLCKCELHIDIHVDRRFIMDLLCLEHLSWCRPDIFFFLRLIKSRGRPGNGPVVTKNFSKTVCCMLNNVSSCKKFVAN
jgi:hypothetical protein